MLRRTLPALAFGAMTLAIAAVSCVTSHVHHDCDYTVHRCRTVCDYGCDSWGYCSPVCYDDCWDECVAGPPPPPAPVTPAPVDAAAPPGAGGRGVLCSPCRANDECGAGALCIQRVGTVDAGSSDAGTFADASSDADAGTGATDAAVPTTAPGFCGYPCQTNAECPERFTCAAIGTSRQCLPSAGACD